MNENASLFFVDRHVDSHIKEKKAFMSMVLIKSSLLMLICMNNLQN